MEYCLPGRARSALNWQIAVLSRLPIVRTRVHLGLGALSNPLLEIGVREEHGANWPCLSRMGAVAFIPLPYLTN